MENFFDWVFRLEDPVEKVEFFDWIRQSEFSVEKVESKKPFFDCVRKLDMGFSRKRPFSTDKYDCIRSGLRGQNLTAVEGNAPVYQVNPVSRITGEERAEFLRTWGPGLDQKGAGVGGGRGGGRVGQLNLCVEATSIHPLRG